MVPKLKLMLLSVLTWPTYQAYSVAFKLWIFFYGIKRKLNFRLQGILVEAQGLPQNRIRTMDFHFMVPTHKRVPKSR